MHAVDPTSSSSLSSPYLRLALAVVLLALALLVLVRRLASQYFLVDAGFTGGAMSIGADGGEGAGAGAGAGAGGSRIEEEEVEVCATCGDSGSKKCSGCKRVRYCSQQCQTKHWRADHKFKCKQMKLHLHQPSRKITNQVLFPYDEFLRLFKWEYDEFSPCGLLNCGNSCYANVVLQCLTFTRPLVAYLLSRNHRSGCFRKEFCFLCQLQIHVQKVREGRSPFSPMNIFSNLPKFSGNLGYGQQEDAHEFMRVAIDAMQLACLDEFGGEKNLDVSSQETTLIQHIFGGHLRSQVICDECEMVSNRYENMMDLTVEIQGDAESLEQCLDQFTAGEWLDGDNKYKCDGCKDYVKAWKRLTVHQPPNILTIALKRFQSGRFGKLNKRITFPMRLDLTPYTSAGVGDGNDLYDLYAVVVHLDMLNASFFGHYICYIKDRQDRWYRADDCKVVMVEPEEVLAQGAYMLLYTRVNPRPGPLTTPKDPPSKQRLPMRIPPSPVNLVGQTENEMSSYPNGGMHHHDVLAGVKGTVETESDVSAMHKNMNDDLAPASPPREAAPISLMRSGSLGVGSFTKSKETENGTPSSSSTNRHLENGTVVKCPKEMLLRGFLDRPYRMKPLEKNRRAPLPGIDQNPDRNTICTSNGVCDRLLPNGDALAERNGLVGVPLSNGESIMKEDSSSSIGSDMDHSSFSIGNGSLKEGEVSSINDGIDRMVVSNSDLNGEVSHSNGYSALVTNNKSKDGIDLETHETVLSQEDGPTQNGLRHRVVHSQSQQVFKAAN